MDFQLNPEQALLLDSVQRFAREHYDFSARGQLLESDDGFSRDHWARFAELGWLGVAIPEEVGGLGWNMVDIALILEAFGGALVLEPFLSTTVLGAQLLLGGSGSTRDTLLPRIPTGDVLLALAAYETAGRFNPQVVATSATADANSWIINGGKCLVFDGGSADWLVVSARLKGLVDDPQGIGLFLVPAEAPGLTLRRYRTIDGLRAADFQFSNVRVTTTQMLAPPGATWNLLDKALDYARVGLCAEAVGVMDRALELAVDYIKVRQQFGQPLANFQVMQHRCADMFVAVDQARSMVYQALSALEADDESRRWAVSACKVKIADAGQFVGGEAVHLHGGNGITDEYSVGHYLRRLMLIEKTYGDTEYHLSRCVENAT